MKRPIRIAALTVALLWSLFVNACNAWIVRPMVQDFAILGVLSVVALVVLWWTSLRSGTRRVWVTYTLFCLLLGDGVSELTLTPKLTSVILGIVMVLGLSALTWLFGRVKWRLLGSSAALLVLANLWLPVDEWPFLTHFWVSYHTTLNLKPTDMSAPPIAIIHRPAGDAVVSLNNLDESNQALMKAAQNATDSNDALENLLRNYGHRYGLVELTDGNRGYQVAPMPEADMAAVDPMQLVNSFFPFVRAFWSEQGNQIVQYMAPTESPKIMAEIANNPAGLPTNIIGLGAESQNQELADWKRLMQNLNLSPADMLRVDHGHLIGPIDGGRVDIPVDGTALITLGSFTAPGQHEALVGGANLLQVVSLTSGSVVSTYHGSTKQPLPNDIVTGPVDNSGVDAVFVNGAPATILRARANGDWEVLYTAPNESLRFEASMRFTGDSLPEIITDDPSQMRDSPTRYFTSYIYRGGELVRNWRVFRPNVVNVHPVQLSPGSEPKLVVATYMSGKIFVLTRHYLPVVPVTSVLLGLVIVAGWVAKFRRRGRAVGA